MHNGCVLWGGVGTGKTVTALAYAKEKEPSRPIVVVTTAKVRDGLSWERWAARMVIDVNKFEVTSWNKVQSFVDKAGYMFIFDEQKVVGSGAWVKAFHKIVKKNRWIMLSATPGDSWSDYSALFIANGWYPNITDFRRKHAIYSRFTNYPKIEDWRDEPTLLRHRKNLLVHMPMERHTTRHMHYLECDYDQDLMDTVRKRRWNIYEDKPIENPAEMFGVMRKVVSTDPSRRDSLASLVQEHPKLIVFYNYNYELEILREICEEAVATRPPSSTNPSESLSTDYLSQNTDSMESKTSDETSGVQETNRTSSEEKTKSWESTTSTRSPETATSLSSPPTSLRPARRRLTKSRHDVLLPEPTARTDAISFSRTLTTPETGTHAEISPTLSTTTASTGSSEWQATESLRTSAPVTTQEEKRTKDRTRPSGVDDGITLSPPSDEQLEKKLSKRESANSKDSSDQQSEPSSYREHTKGATVEWDIDNNLPLYTRDYIKSGLHQRFKYTAADITNLRYIEIGEYKYVRGSVEQILGPVDDWQWVALGKIFPVGGVERTQTPTSSGD